MARLGTLPTVLDDPETERVFFMEITNEQWSQYQGWVTSLKKEIRKAVVGQDATVELMLAALFCRGHCLIVGVPGLGKTLLVRTFGQALGLRFNRIQFTPDLMPTDIVGSEILQTRADGSRAFEYAPGPIFANLLLADEINRTPPKTQAALLEAMQEKQVTVAGVTRKLEEPFIVYATQNPIEHEGTYPLPEAQLDRFFFHLTVAYPTLNEEKRIMHGTLTEMEPVQTVVHATEVMELQRAVQAIPTPEHVGTMILKLVQASRPQNALADDYINRYVSWGAGPRASQTLALAAKALAFLRGRTGASVEEVRDAALPVLRHRIIPNYNATGEGIQVEEIIAHLLKRGDLTQ
jgi:MoxR-like ATPase